MSASPQQRIAKNHIYGHRDGRSRFAYRGGVNGSTSLPPGNLMIRGGCDRVSLGLAPPVLDGCNSVTGLRIEPRTYGLKALHLPGLTWYQDTLTTENVRGAHTLKGRVCTSWYMRVRGSGAQ